MSATQVIYHREDGVWWAESPDVEGFGASADTLEELRPLVRQGLAFYLEDDGIGLDERFPYAVVLSAQIETSMDAVASAGTAGLTVVRREVVQPAAVLVAA